jgi:hypothetical protein
MFKNWLYIRYFRPRTYCATLTGKYDEKLKMPAY